MALEMVAAAFLSASLQVLFDRLARPEVVDFLLRRKKFNHVLLQKLKIKLISVNALLNDAEEKQITNPAVKQWLEELEDAAYDADDLLDEIATDALLDKLEADESSGSGTSGNVSENSKENVSGIEERMEKIFEMVEFTANQKDLLDLKVIEAVASPRQPTTSLVAESEVYGRCEDKKKVLEMLLEERKDGSNLHVIAIVGMGWVGKTTLAQLLYNHGEVEVHFELKSWVYISERFDISTATKTVLTAVTDHPSHSSYDNKDLNWLQNRLKEALTGKRLLLVLDNVWNEIWEDMSKPFKHVARGSRILITTRHEDVAKMMGTISTPYHLGGLDVNACWQLFAKRAFDDHTVPDVRKKMEGKFKDMIVKKCGGLPLAAETLGGLLHYKETEEEWGRILKSEILDISYEDSKIRPVLMLSYRHLPLYLKPCFAFCSIYPKGYEFHKHQLVLLWMAANLLQKPKRSKMTMEELGYKYFEQLSSRLFFQKSSGGEESRFVMHDLIHDLAQYVSRGHYFTLEDGNSEEVTMKVRHLVVASHVSHRTLDSILKTTHLRTLLPSSSNSFDYLSNKAVNDIVSKLTRLRVLNLSWCKNFKELPEKIGDLKHLRSLDLSNTLVKRLPRSVSRSYNLQILKLSRCRKLSQLPDDMHRLVNLRHLYVDGCHNIKEMPRQIGRLKSLQTLTTFIVGKNGEAQIGELRELSELRGNLSVQNLENVANAEDASKARLANKNKLEELTLSWSNDVNGPKHDEGVLKELLSGTELKRLNIIGYRGTGFPNCFTSSSIVSIKLKRCIDCLSLPALGELPSLKTLYIKELDTVTTVDDGFYGTKGNFGSLESLSFSSMLTWKEWNSTVNDREVYPKLKELCIRDCHSLTTVHLPQKLKSLTKLVIQSTVPYRWEDIHSSDSATRFPAEFLPTLTHVEIKNCQNLKSFRLHSFPSLTHLDLVSCENLEDIEVVDRKPLGSLFIKGCPNFISFSGNWLEVCNLNSLTIEDCKELVKLPDLPPSLKQLWIIKCPKVKSFSFPAEDQPSTLNGLLVDKCSNLTANLMECSLKKFEALEFFDIRDESDALMVAFPKKDFLPSKLTSLTIGPLASLEELDLQYLTSLKCLDIKSCPKLTTLKDDGASEAPTLPELRSLFIKDCQDFTSFPEVGLKAPCLKSLTVQGCEKLENLPRQMHDFLQSLESLWIIDCPKMGSFPEGGLPSKLNGLLVSNCTSLITNQNAWKLQKFQALEFFDIRDKGSSVESFPDKGLLPPTLTWLSIGPLASLKKLEKLESLTSLKSLIIKECPILEELSQLPASLTCLTINNCDALKESWQREKEKYWKTISHIPRIHIDDEPI